MLTIRDDKPQQTFSELKVGQCFIGPTWNKIYRKIDINQAYCFSDNTIINSYCHTNTIIPATFELVRVQ